VPSSSRHKLAQIIVKNYKIVVDFYSIKADSKTDSSRTVKRTVAGQYPDSNRTVNPVSAPKQKDLQAPNKLIRGEGNKEREESTHLLEKRKQEFINEVNAQFKYPPRIRSEFIHYWTETNRVGNKMRFELQKTWQTPNRLSTWARRDGEFTRKTPPNIGSKILG
jgi:hypothetical protein